MSGLFSKESILRACARSVETFEVPEWSGEVRLMEPTAFEKDQWESGRIKQGRRTNQMNLSNFRASLVALCLVNETNQRIFSTDEDVEQLGQMPVKGMDRVYTKCLEICGMRPEDEAFFEKASTNGAASGSGIN